LAAPRRGVDESDRATRRTGVDSPSSRVTRSSGVDTQRAGLEALRLLVHHPDLVADRLEPALFTDTTQRSTLEVLKGSASVHEAIQEAERSRPDVASLLRRLAVEEPLADTDDVVVQLVRFAARKALVEVDAQARLAPESFAEMAALSAQVKKSIEDLDQPELSNSAAHWLLAWLMERAEEIA
jgi:hypothetical protein